MKLRCVIEKHRKYLQIWDVKLEICGEICLLGRNTVHYVPSLLAGSLTGSTNQPELREIKQSAISIHSAGIYIRQYNQTLCKCL